MLLQLLAQWGYLAVGIGTFFEGETIVLAAGALAHRGVLWWPGVVLAAFAGSLLGDQLWFFVGRRYGRAFITKRPPLRVHVQRVEGWLARFGVWFVLGFRFVYGVRTVSPIVLGASGYSVARFVPLNIVGALLWAFAFVGAGLGLGAGLRALLGRVTRLEEVLGCALLLSLLLWWLRTRRQRAQARERGPTPS
jgi:membrane protein DedA with SNARE-associated domain